MANLKSLGQFVNGLKGDRLFNTGIMGTTSLLQHQTDELKRAYAQLHAQPDSKETHSSFKSALFSAHATSVITDVELDQCEQWLEEN